MALIIIIIISALQLYDQRTGTKYNEITDYGQYYGIKDKSYDYEVEFNAWQALQDERNRQYEDIDRQVPNNQIKPPETINTSSESENPKRFKPDTTMQNETMETETAKSAAGASTAMGHHGPYHGHGNRHVSFEKHRMERQIVKSHQRKDLINYWGLSRFETDYDIDDVPKIGDIALLGVKLGVGLFNTGFTNATMRFPYNTNNFTSICNQVYAMEFNLKVGDFIDICSFSFKKVN